MSRTSKTLGVLEPTAFFITFGPSPTLTSGDEAGQSLKLWLLPSPGPGKIVRNYSVRKTQWWPEKKAVHKGTDQVF